MLHSRRGGRRIRGVAAAVAVGIFAALPSARTWAIASAIPSDRPRPDTNGESPGAVDAAEASHAFRGLSLRFEANRGQTDPNVDFLARGPGYTLFVSRTQAVLGLAAATGASSSSGEVVRMSLLGANPGPSGTGSNRLPGVTNYIVGTDREQWVTNVPSFATVTYRDVYPGVDLVYYGDERQRVEYDFNIAPGAAPGAIALAFEGHRGLSVDSSGNLVVATRGDNLVQHRPVLYQNIDGARQPVGGSYRIEGDRVGFDIGAYDPSLPLVIDPVLSYSSFVGGMATDEVNGIAAGRSDGFAYVTGKTCSTDFPTAAPQQEANAGNCDAFVAKFDTNASGSASLVYATYLGGKPTPLPKPAPSKPYQRNVEDPAGGSGSYGNAQYTYTNEDSRGEDAGLGIAVDDAGHVYVTGQTTSEDFPTTPNGYDRSCGTRADGACYSTHEESAPTLSGAVTVTIHVDFTPDVFVTKLVPTGSDLAYSTYLGGSADKPPNPAQTEKTGADVGRAIAVDGLGDAYVVGSTTSRDFPTKNPFQAQLAASYSCTGSTTCGQQRPDTHSDSFVVKLDTTVKGSDQASRAASLLFGTYHGYQDSTSSTLQRWRDVANGIAVGHPSSGPPGAVYVAGTTFSHDGVGDAFVLSVATNGAKISEVRLGEGSRKCSLAQCESGSGSDEAASIDVDPAGRVFVAGRTNSVDLFDGQEPQEGPPPLQPTRSGEHGEDVDAWVASFEPSLAVRYATYLGSSEGDGTGYTDDVATAVTADADGAAYVVGFTHSDLFPMVEPLQSAHNSREGSHPGDAFVARLAPGGSALDWSTYLGGGPTAGTLADGEDKASAVALDDDGNVYVGGRTLSNDFPTVESFQPGRGGSIDGFVSKIAPAPGTRPHVVAMQPPEGPPGTRVIITGVGFSGAKPQFGDVPASTYSVESDNRIVAVAPAPERLGQAVTVSVHRGSSVAPSGSPSRFTYHQGRWRPTEADDIFFPQATFTVLGGPACSTPHRPSYCGKVLLAGGQGGERTTRLYDPKTGRWTASGCTPTGPDCPGRLTVSRFQHTATLLANGLVLVVGGDRDPVHPEAGRRTAELYDPSSGLWSPTGDMATNHADGHTATLLDGPPCHTTEQPDYCGKVLVVGARTVRTSDARQKVDGSAPGPDLPEAGLEGATATAQLFDPDAESPSVDPAVPPRRGGWTLTSDPSISRNRHTAVGLSGSGCGANCGKVLVMGGYNMAQQAQEPTVSTELYDPRTASWSVTAGMAVPRADHTATPVGDGKVLVAGGKSIVGAPGNPVASAEIFDPAATDPEKTWRLTGSMRTVRHAHSAVALPGGQVLVVGNADPRLLRTAELYQPDRTGMGEWQSAGALEAGSLDGGPAALLSSRTGGFGADPAICGQNCGRVLFGSYHSTSNASLYTPPPWITGISKKGGPVEGGLPVALTGGGFDDSTQVFFGRVPATTEFVSYEQIRAVSPPSEPAMAALRAVSFVPSDPVTPEPDRRGVGVGVASVLFTVGLPARVTDLVAETVSTETVKLSFSAPGAAGGTGPPARSYVIKQSRSPITKDNFDAAKSLCKEGVCGGYEPAAVGDGLALEVSGLVPGTPYHYALKAVDDNGAVGDMSNQASAVTLPGGDVTFPPADVSDAAEDKASHDCAPQLPAPRTDQVAYAAGYSLVSLPPGTIVGSRSPLYSWFDLGNGGDYGVRAADAPVEAGHGYWAWFSCSHLVDLASAGETATSFELGAFHASMVGNPSGQGPSTVSGHDFTARWDGSLNDGSGGYRLSAYREPQSLAVGEGIWAFSYDRTTLVIQRR